MQKRLGLCFFVVAITLITLLCSACNSSSAERISLEEGWSYSLAEDGDFSLLKLSDLKNLAPLVPGGSGCIWLEKRFTVPLALQSLPLGCYLGRITLADETFLNGAFIGGEGSFPPAVFSAWNKPRLYTIPQNLLVEGENRLLVKILVEGEGSIVSRPFIGTMKDASHAALRESFWASKIQLMFAFLMFIIGIYHLLMYIKYPKERDNRAFGLINLLSALYLCVFYYVELPFFSSGRLSFLWFQKIFSSGLPYFLPFLVTTYINGFLKRADRREIFIVRVVFVALPVLVVLCCPSYRLLRLAQPLLQFMLIPPMVYILYILGVSVVRKQKDSLTLLIGFSPLVIAVVLDFLIHTVLHLYDFPYISSIGWQLVIVTLLFIMANRFANSRLQVEYLNRNLEKEVADRTKELSQSNERLSLTNEELASAKRRADRDMQLAEYVQRCFYQRSVPRLDGWDLAWHFKPMAGVSGDLYDVFCDGKTLQGVGLFDVSGHGIASGLVTMLAKTVIDRKFHEGLRSPLVKVMHEINRQIVEEKGEVENYLTGVLIRVDGDRLEYLNAGHPKAFFRLASGRTAKIALAGKDNGGGSLIGMPMLEPEYKAIGFSMHPGDSILLYTDCLSESRNTGGEEYGYDRIEASFAAARGSAQAMVEQVLADFASFTEGCAVNDDLTLMVLQKK